jgi:hypothetical protein
MKKLGKITTGLDVIHAQKSKYQDQMLRLRVRLKKHLESETWQKVFAAVDKTLKEVC